MTSTEELYGMSNEQLNAILGQKVHKVMCQTRIDILNKRLKTITYIDVLDPRIRKINKAIKHWKHLLEEDKE